MKHLAKTCASIVMASALTLPAFAASDGSTGVSSTGSMDIRMDIDVRSLVRISGLDDVAISYDTEDFESNASISDGSLACLFYSEEDGSVLVEASSAHGDQIPSDATPGFFGAVEHEQLVGKEIQRSYLGYKLKMRVGNTNYQFGPSQRQPINHDASMNEGPNCSGGDNLVVTIDFNNVGSGTAFEDVHTFIDANNLQGTGQLTLTDTITIVVEPNL